MAQIALTLSPAYTVALRLVGPAGAAFEMAKPTVPMAVAAMELMRGPPGQRGTTGLQGEPGPFYAGDELPDMRLIFDNQLI